MTTPDVWESEVYHALRWRERLAWRIAAGAALLAFLAIASFSYFFSTHDVRYIVVTVDRATGDTNISSEVDRVDVSTDEVLAEAFVYQYVRDRETYHHFDQVRRINEIWDTFSAGEAKDELFLLYAEDNPANPIERYGRGTRIDVRIKSIVLQPTEEGVEGLRAQVRLEKTFTTGTDTRSQNYIVTMAFFSDLDKEATKEFRRKNPAAFFVTDYRIDPESS